MKRHAVPQNIMDVEFKLFGSFTIRQFMNLAVCIGFALGVYAMPLPDVLKWPIIVLLVLLGLALALLTINGQPFSVWLGNFLNALMTSQRRVWKKSPRTPDILRTEQKISGKYTTHLISKSTKLKSFDMPLLKEEVFDEVDRADKVEEENLDRLNKHFVANYSESQRQPSQIVEKQEQKIPEQPIINRHTNGLAGTALTEKEVERVQVVKPKIQNTPQTVDSNAPKPSIRESLDFDMDMSEDPLDALKEESPIPNSKFPNSSDEAFTQFDNSQKTEDRGQESGVGREPNSLDVKLKQDDITNSKPETDKPLSDNLETEISKEDFEKSFEGGSSKLNEEADVLAKPIPAPINASKVEQPEIFEKKSEPKIVEDEVKQESIVTPIQSTPQVSFTDEKDREIERLKKQIEEFQNQIRSQNQEDDNDLELQRNLAEKIDMMSAEIKSLRERVDGQSTKPIPELKPQSTDRPNIVNGIVVDKEDNPVSGVSVEVKDSQGFPLRKTISDKNGLFTMSTPLPNGEYILDFEKVGKVFTDYKINLTGTVVPNLKFKEI